MVSNSSSIRFRPIHITTYLLIFINLGIFLLAKCFETDLSRIFQLYGLVPIRDAHLEFPLTINFKTFLTYMYIHTDGLHLLGNMFFLWLFGRQIEEMSGFGLYIGLFTVFGMLTGVFHVLSNAESFRPLVGASGGIAGLMGLFIVFFPHARINLIYWPFPNRKHMIEISAAIIIISWLSIQLINGALCTSQYPSEDQNIDWWGHLFGFGLGLSSGIIFLYKPIRFLLKNQ